jgi:hypothetical protein
MPLVFTTSFLFFLIVCGLMSFPAVFMMRVIGLYGLYFRADLAVVNEFPDLEPVGFGPRYLAFLVDYIILGLLGGVGQFVGGLFGLLFTFYGWSSADQLAQGVGAVASLGLFGFYFSSGESGAARATLGKWSLGMIVLRDDNKVHDDQDREDNRADDEVALHQEVAERLDDLAGSIGALVTVTENQLCRCEVEREPEDCRDQQDRGDVGQEGGPGLGDAGGLVGDRGGQGRHSVLRGT